MVEDFVNRTLEERRDARTWKYKAITDDGTGTEETVWEPSTGKHVRMAAAIISVTGPGTVVILFGSRTVAVLEFEQRRTIPLYLPFDLQTGENEAVNVRFTSSSGTATCNITIIGEEV